MILILIVFLAVTAIGLSGATLEGIWGGSGGPTPKELRDRHSQTVRKQAHPYHRQRRMTPTEPHVGNVGGDGLRFNTIEYAALVARAEERIDEVHCEEGSDL